MKNPMKEAYISNVLYGDSYTLRKFKESDEDFDEIEENSSEEEFDNENIEESNEEENDEEMDRDSKLDELVNSSDILEDWRLEINSKTNYSPLDVNVSREKRGVIVSFTMDDVIGEDEQVLVDEEFTSAMTDELIKLIDGIDFNYDTDGSNTVKVMFW